VTSQPEPAVSIHGARNLSPEARQAVEALIQVAKKQIGEQADDSGPSIAEATANDRRWPLEREGQ
jgi:hypothetical protein